jgi:hypothetical protein
MQNEIKKLDDFLRWFYEMNPTFSSIDCSEPENVLMPDGHQYRMIYHCLGWTDLTDDQIYDGAPIFDGLLHIALFDLMCPYDESANVFYVTNEASTKFFELDRVQKIIDHLELNGAVVLINGYMSDALMDKLKKDYPEIVLKHFSYVLYKDSDEMQIQPFSLNFTCNIVSLLAGRPDIHRYWALNELKKLNADQVNISEKSDAYISDTWTKLLYQYTNETVNPIENKDIVVEVPGYNTDNKFDPAIFEFIKSGAVTVVTESVFFYPTSWLTGRTLIPLSCARPFVLIAPPHTLSFLHHLGFRTFSDWWDESYDTIVDPKQRMLKIFDLVRKISIMSKQEVRSMLREMEDTLEHNKSLVKSISSNQLASLDQK